MHELALSFHGKAKGLAADYLRTEGELLSLLIEMKKRRLFAVLNYSGIFDYCERALHLSRAQAYYFKTVAEKAIEVPEIRTAVVKGDLTLSEARRIAPVVTPENHQHWPENRMIDKAKSMSQKDLEREVSSHNPKAHPVVEKIRSVDKKLSELKVAVDESTEKNLEALKDILSQKLGKAASLGEVVAWALKVTRDKFDPVCKAERSQVLAEARKIDGAISSRKLSSNESSLQKPGNPSKQPRAEEPPVEQPSVNTSETKGRKPLPASVRHQVYLRDKAQCTYTSTDQRRCKATRWLDLHHMKPVSQGGGNTVENLTLYCKMHHGLTHASSHEAIQTSGAGKSQPRFHG